MSQGKSALNIIRRYHPNVAKVVEAKRDTQIRVTAEDCRAGKRKGPSSCAMAKAFEREYDGAIVSLSVAYLIKGDVATRYVVPQAVSREIVSFDRAKKFEPGEYSLKAPSKHRTMKAERASAAARNGGPAYRNSPKYMANHNKPKARQHRTAGIRAL